jgi:PAS domain S-box-containing protein
MERWAARQTHLRKRGASGSAAQLGGEIDDALENVDLPAAILDRAGVIRWLNARAIETVGDLRGRHFTSFVAPEATHSARRDVATLLLGSEPRSQTQSVLRTPDADRIPVELHTVALKDGGYVVGIFGIVVEQHDRQSAPEFPELTPRQHEVLAALGRGASTNRIATELGISRETVRNHIRAILRAFQVHSRLEAIIEARRRDAASATALPDASWPCRRRDERVVGRT